MRAEQILPDHVDQADFKGVPIRKGTVAAFLANARIWTDPDVSETARAQAEIDLAEALPALRALGLFELLEVRDVSLRDWVSAH